MNRKNLTVLARSMRKESTSAERELWKILRNRGIDGHKFVRQFPIPPYIVDFCCRERRLVIEVDGSGHLEKQDKDKQRENFLGSLGYRVIRFNNDQVLKELDQVYEAILAELSESLS
jgi:very-short-patch-repair endonuclease